MGAMIWSGTNAAGGTVGAGVTVYITPGITWVLGDTGETSSYYTLRTAGQWRGLYVRIASNATTGTSTMQSRLNVGSGAQALSIGAAATGEFRDDLHADAVAAGDEIAIQLVNGGGGTLWHSIVSTLFQPTNTAETIILHVTRFGPDQTLNGVTRYYAINGFRGPNGGNTVEANMQTSLRARLLFRHLFAIVRTNTKGGDSFLRVRKNTANGNQVITIGAGVTGILEDTTNADIGDDGDEVNFSVDFFADGNNLRFFTSGVTAVSALNEGMLHFGDGGEYVGMTGATKYESWGPSTSTTVENNVRSEMRLPGTFARASLYVSTNTTAADNLIALRKNGASTGLRFTIGSGATGQFENLTGRELFSATDEVAWEYDAAASGGVILNNLAVMYRTTNTFRTAHRPAAFAPGLAR